MKTLKSAILRFKHLSKKWPKQKKETPNFLDLKKIKFDGIISYKVAEQVLQFPVEISIKGFTSAVYCKFPKLELKIKNGQNSIFSGFKKIDLNTHCDDSLGVNAQDPFVSSMSANHREVVNYRIQKIMGLQTYLTKPVFVSYIDSETKSAPEAAPKNSYPAFFIEDKSEFVKKK